MPMPRVRVSTGIALHYTEYGDGPPLVLLEGVQSNWVWHPTVPALSRFFRVILLDHRGTGLSDKPAPPYSVMEMARETADVIAGLGHGPAHLMGLSLGGSVAQEVALSHPGLVRRLVLVGSSPGGWFQFPPCPYELLRETMIPELGPEYNLRRILPGAISPQYYRDHPAEFELMVQLAGAQLTPPYARSALFSAGFLWPGVAGRSSSMQAPALAVNGGLDLVSPVSNAFWLTNLLPLARLHLFPHSGHLCNWEHREEFNQVVANFLAEPG